MSPINFNINLIVALCILTSCAGAKIANYSSKPRIVSGHTVLLTGIQGVSEGREYQLFESASHLLSKSNPVKFLPIQLYEILNEGIGMEALKTQSDSDSIYEVIATKLNYRYILSVTVLGSKKGYNLSYYTPFELNEHNYTNNQFADTNTAKLLFEILDISDGLVVKNKFEVDAYISPLTIREHDDSELRINTSSERGVISLAFKKGIKHMRKGVIKK